MKRSISLFALLSLALLLAACGGSPAQTVAAIPAADAQPVAEPVESAPEADVADTAPADTVESASEEGVAPAEVVALNMDYEGALSQKLLLSLGTMELVNTEYAVNAEQGQLMLFYWQALNNMTASGNSATEEVAAILLQIEETFTAEQISAINEMRLNTDSLQVWATENQVTMGTGTGTGGGQGGGGGMDADARATKQAAEGVTNPSGGRENGIATAVNNALIAYLESIQ